MNEQQKKNDFVEELMGKIHEQRIHMHSKKYFIMRSALYIGIIILAAIFTVFLLSLLFYYLRASGAIRLISLGPDGIRDFLSALPVSIFIGGVVGIGLVVLLALRFRMTFKRPLLFTLGSVFVGILLGSIFVSYLPLHNSFFNAVKEGHAPPFAGALHEQLFRRRLANTIVGEIISIDAHSLTIQDQRGDERTLIVDDATEYPRNEKPDIDDTVLIRTHSMGDVLYADAVMVIGGDTEDFYRPRPRFIPRLPVRNMEPPV